MPYLPGDMLQDKEKYFGGVAEPWWINSKGIGIWVPEGIPLHYSWNEDQSMQMCLKAAHDEPYPRSKQNSVQLRYKLCVKENAKEIQLYGAENLLGLPTGIPDTRMLSKPIWSTWAQYKTNVSKCREFILLSSATLNCRSMKASCWGSQMTSELMDSKTLS